MQDDSWQKQGTEPLFKNLIWDKPENKSQAGKLLIIGGNKFSFSVPAMAYQYANDAGVGAAKVLLPNSLQKYVGKQLSDGEFAPSNKSGSFSTEALSSWLDLADWADGVLLSGDFGRNSETAILLDKFIDKYAGALVVGNNTLDNFIAKPHDLLQRSQTTIILTFEDFQKLNKNLQQTQAITSKMPINNFALQLQELSQKHSSSFIVNFENTVFVAEDGQISSTKVKELDLIKLSSWAAVWLIQNPENPFEALTTAIFELSQL